MWYFKAKNVSNSILAGAPLQTPLRWGSLQRLELYGEKRRRDQDWEGEEELQNCKKGNSRNGSSSRSATIFWLKSCYERSQRQIKLTAQYNITQFGS